MRNLYEKYEDDFITREKLEQNFRDFQCKLSDFSLLIFSQAIFKDTISGFHETDTSTLNAIKRYTGVFILARAISCYTLFAEKKYSSVFIEQVTYNPKVIEI